MPECLRVCVCVCVCVRFVSQTWMYNIKSEDWAGKDCSPPRSAKEKAELQKGRVSMAEYKSDKNARLRCVFVPSLSASCPKPLRVCELSRARLGKCHVLH